MTKILAQRNMMIVPAENDPQRAVARGLEQLTSSYVHLDVDLYQSTVSGLEWFYPRLNPGAVLISHDYDADGVRKAFDGFLSDKPECIVGLAGSRVGFVKV